MKIQSKDNEFDKYTVKETTSASGCGYEIGAVSYEIKGPKQTFFLKPCVNPLRIYKPGQQVKEVPLFYVISLRDFPCVSSIKKAQFFAIIDEQLVPYRRDGRGCLRPL